MFNWHFKRFVIIETPCIIKFDFNTGLINQLLYFISIQCHNCTLESGEETCQEYQETSCTTRYVETSPGKHLGDTACERIPVRLCADVSCEMEPGPQECHNKVV